jgi:hypothetical protein
MSEDTDDPSSSGKVPKERKPTTFKPKGETPMAPTVFDPSKRKGTEGETQPARSVTPTVIQGTRPEQVQEDLPPVRPTVMAPPPVPKDVVAPRPTAFVPPTTPSPAPAPMVSQPSVIQGTVRKGIEVSVDDLLKRFPGTSRETLEEAQSILKRKVLELLGDVECTKWGERAQHEFGELTGRSLTLVGHDTVEDCERHLSRLFTVLNELADAIQDNGGMLPPWKKRPELKDLYEEHEEEISQLRGLLKTNYPVLAEVEAKLVSLVAEYHTLSTTLDAEYCAAMYVADVLLDKRSKSREIGILLSRAGSLQETVANVQQSQLLREQAAGQLQQLAARVQNGVLNALPVWLEQITLALQQAKVTPTETFTLRKALTEVVQKLKRN